MNNKVDPKYSRLFPINRTCPGSLAPHLWIIRREYAKNGSYVETFEKGNHKNFFQALDLPQAWAKFCSRRAMRSALFQSIYYPMCLSYETVSRGSKEKKRYLIHSHSVHVGRHKISISNKRHNITTVAVSSCWVTFSTRLQFIVGSENLLLNLIKATCNELTTFS